MDRKTNLREMAAPAVGSGKDADETILKGTASRTPSESGKNTLKEWKTGAQPKGNPGGRNAFQ